MPCAFTSLVSAAKSNATTAVKAKMYFFIDRSSYERGVSCGMIATKMGIHDAKKCNPWAPSLDGTM